MIEFKRLTVLPKIWCTKDLTFHQCPLRRKLSCTDCTWNEVQCMCASKQILHVSFMRVCAKLLQSLYAWYTYYIGIYTTQQYIVPKK